MPGIVGSIPSSPAPGLTGLYAGLVEVAEGEVKAAIQKAADELIVEAMGRAPLPPTAPLGAGPDAGVRLPAMPINRRQEASGETREDRQRKERAAKEVVMRAFRAATEKVLVQAVSTMEKEGDKPEEGWKGRGKEAGLN